MFNYYLYKNKVLFSHKKKYDLKTIALEEALSLDDVWYFVNELNPYFNKRSFLVTDPSQLFIENESLELLKKSNNDYNIPEEINKMIEKKKIKYVNTSYPNFENEFIDKNIKKKKRVNILALGDVGSTLLIGLHLLGSDCIDTIGIYDQNDNVINRWEHEINQIQFPFEYNSLPDVVAINKDELFNCDMFIFCASRSVPKVGSNVKDVRMIQYEGNAKIIEGYAKMARLSNFKGIFAVVSDPVDLLCKTAFLSSNKNEFGEMDFCGLAPEQIKGYGLGVMNARASYYAKKDKRFEIFLTEGRSFGPHGKDLIIADSIFNYNDDLSKELTNLVVNANIEIRKVGFKPFVAPALSSGAISIILTLSNKWHYSSNFLGGVYMGAKNRNTSVGLEFEQIDIPKSLFNRLEKTYKKLGEFN